MDRWTVVNKSEGDAIAHLADRTTFNYEFTISNTSETPYTLEDWEVVNSLFTVTGSDDVTLTLPTALQIWALIPDCQSGTSFDFWVKNNMTANTVTLQSDGNTSITGGNTVAAETTHLWKGICSVSGSTKYVFLNKII